MAVTRDIFGFLDWGRGCHWHLVGTDGPPAQRMIQPQMAVWRELCTPARDFAPGQIEFKALPLPSWPFHLGRLMAFPAPGTRMDKLYPARLTVVRSEWHVCSAWCR